MGLVNSGFLLLISVLASLTITGCKDQNKGRYEVRPNYDYTLKAKLSDGGGESGCGNSTKYTLARKDQWTKKYSGRYFSESGNPETVMYIYRIRTRYEFNSILIKCAVVSGDTLISDVSKQQADSLFDLAKAVFNNVIVTNLDTVYDGKDRLLHYVIHDASGALEFENKSTHVEMYTGGLSSSTNIHAAPFMALVGKFEAVFSKVKK
ncbi:hypothetical protein [Hymenobacter sp. ISL-91]|uniref:hypothetical protein n=1 Tax=Hymenobacter sp. ISL-91 TaxID=2819151 RepID=UPI001BE6AE51|nr:hypothetical protein [Hymenobacter sp. ISL-91]